MTDKKIQFPRVDYNQIPEHMRRGMKLYLEFGEFPGGFLLSVLARDLQFAAKRADGINRYQFLVWIDFLLAEIPANAWGSYENVYRWMIHRKAYHENKITAEEIDDLIHEQTKEETPNPDNEIPTFDRMGNLKSKQ